MSVNPKRILQITRTAAIPANIGEKFLGALQVFPAGKVYENMEADEQVILLIRRHWITRVSQVLFVGMLALAPIIALVGLAWLEWRVQKISYAVVFSWFWYVYVFYYALSRFVIWQSDVYILTNERMIDFDANPVSRKQVRDTDLDSIHEVTYASGGGLLKGSLDYGDVVLHSISDVTVMRNIPMPSKVAMVIGEVIEEIKRNGQAATKEVVKDEMI